MSLKQYKIIILTGLSGSGKSTALTALEDSGFYCVDNLPVELLPKFLELPANSSAGPAGLAFVMDLRDRTFLKKYAEVFSLLREKGYNYELVFLEADEAVLVRRFSQTRRPHPVSENDILIDNIKAEIKKFAELRTAANRVIDTSDYNYHKLKSVMGDLISTACPEDKLRINFMSFGFKYGIPAGADLVVDVRFIQNPYFIDDLREMSGLDKPVRNYVIENDNSKEFLEKYISLLKFLIPLYKKEGKSYLTIAVGCTGGRHRSVAVAETIYDKMKHMYKLPVKISHRDIDL